MKLNADWDHMYRNATLGFQHRLEELELENAAVKQLNSRLLLRVEHQQVNTQRYFKGRCRGHGCNSPTLSYGFGGIDGGR